LKRWYPCAVLCLWLSGATLAVAQAPAPAGAGAMMPAAQVALDQWLLRLHNAPRGRSYSGTFVVTTSEFMSSSRIWHVCNGQQQLERVESLTGEPRSIFRRDDQVITLFPASRLAVRERRESLGLFPDLLRRAEGALAAHYRLEVLGVGRVAGLPTEVVQLVPSDALRYGYRIWTERSTGLVVKLQTLDAGQQVLEQAAFSELQLAAPVTLQRLSAQMDQLQGYQVRSDTAARTTAEQHGWRQTAQVAGFTPVRCHQRGDDATGLLRLQCAYSDGLATVSLFVEPFDARSHTQVPGQSRVLGATQVLTRRYEQWWLTAVGEVPRQTLALFLQGLERQK